MRPNVWNGYLILTCLLLCAWKSQCQELKFYTPPGNISQNSISSIHQDKNGFLWFGTRYGVNRYNGLEFKTFLSEKGNDDGLRSNTISCFINDYDGNIWFGTLGGGLTVYDIELQSYSSKYKEALKGIDNYHINTLYMDSKENIWIGTLRNGVKLLKKGADQLKHFVTDPNYGIPSNKITGINEDKFGNIIISTWNSGLCFYNPNKGVFKTYSHVNEPMIPRDNIIRCLSKGKTEDLWIGTHHGVLKLHTDSLGNPVFNKLSLENAKGEPFLKDGVILCLEEDSKSRLWVGTENKGLLLHDLKQQQTVKYQYDQKEEYNIESNSIWSIFEDQHGTVWVGTYKNGIKKVDPREQKIQKLTARSNSKFNISYGLVSSFAEDENGNLWIGTDGGGLNFISREPGFKILDVQNSPVPGLDSEVIVTLINDKRGRLWVGTWGKGLYIKEKGEREFRSINYDPKKYTNDITLIYEAPHENIWICQYRKGLDLYVPSEDKYYQFEPSVNTNSISSQDMITVVEDREGTIWAGTADKGIDRFQLNDKKEIINLKNFSFSNSKQPGLSENEVFCLYIDNREVLWAGTEGGGLKKYNAADEKFEHITKEDGLPSNIIYGILDDGEKLWVSTGSGLASISFDNAEIQAYDINDGLQSNEFTRNACYKTRDGVLLFGGTNGFNYFSPESISMNDVIPDVSVSGISVRQKNQKREWQRDLNRQLASGKVTLKGDQNDIDFEFSALSYTQSGKNTYSYILENYDKEWKNVQNITSASYTNIPPGDYLFRVKASNNDGVWNPNPAILKLKILPPWYKTTLACFFYSFLLLGILILIYLFIIRHERLQNQLKLEQLELTRMEELNKVKSRFFANISHEFKTPLTLIISPLKAIQKRLEKVENKSQINLMLRNAERLLILINQILALSKLEAGSEKLKASKFNIVEFARNITNIFYPYAEEQFITFEVEVPDEVINLYFEKDKIEKVLINLISNAFKFTPEFGQITFRLEKIEDQVKMTISDTGIGISSEQLEHIFERFYHGEDNRKNSGTGIGLSLSKQLVELHKGTISAKSNEGKGATFEVLLPMGKAHLENTQIIELFDDHTLSEDSKIELKDFNIKTKQEELAPEATGSNLPVVLIAEDNSDLRSFTRTYLQSYYQIIEAENGLQAFQRTIKHIPDIVITDWMMPEMTGFELAEKLREDERTNHITILMVTVKSSEESKEEGFKGGVDYYITKPFNPKLLHLRIQNILKTRKKYKAQVLKNSVSLNTEKNSETLISSKDEDFLNKIVIIIDKNINNSKLNIDFICKNIGFSKSQLYRKMKGLVGQSANEFIRFIRLKRAAELLLTENHTISEVTYKVGFNDLQYFRNCFKTQYGMTPSEYIQQTKKEGRITINPENL